MPRDASGVYSKPAGTTAAPNTTIESAQFNTSIDDLAQDANTPRPVTAGGTGATSTVEVRDALDVAIKQTGTGDTTAGSSMIVGAGGILGNALALGTETTFSAVTKQGFFRIPSLTTMTDRPTGLTGAALLHNYKEASDGFVRNLSVLDGPSAGQAWRRTDRGVAIGTWMQAVFHNTTIRIADGTSSAPGLTFASDTNTGLYRRAENEIAIVSRGSIVAYARDSDLSFVTGKVAGGGMEDPGLVLARDGGFVASCNGAAPITANRNTNDGGVILIYQAGILEGSINVSGPTVSYNSFCGSHWSQTAGSPDIILGTVVESVDEMCAWEGEINEHLPMFKVSDTEGSRSVYGVFMGWDEDGDAMIAGLGAFLVRVRGPVARGDLLESAGDGTARVQAADLVRSSTIGKVTAAARGQTFEDESYLVPAVLYCG